MIVWARVRGAWDALHLHPDLWGGSQHLLRHTAMLLKSTLLLYHRGRAWRGPAGSERACIILKSIIFTGYALMVDEVSIGVFLLLCF